MLKKFSAILFILLLLVVFGYSIGLTIANPDNSRTSDNTSITSFEDNFILCDSDPPDTVEHPWQDHDL